MIKDTYKLWVNAEQGVFYSAFGSNTPGSAPLFIQGDTVDVEVHLVHWSQGTTRYLEEVPFPAGSTLRLAIGKVDTAPTSGTFNVSYGTDTASNLSHAITASALQTALNALPSIAAAGNVVVTRVATSTFRIQFNNPGVNLSLQVNALGVSPPSYSKVITLQTGTTSAPGIFLIKVKQAPVVYQDDWDDLDEPTLTVTTLAANRSKRVSISPVPKAGSWSLTGTKTIDTSKTDADVTIDDWNTLITKRLSVGATSSDFREFQYLVTKVDEAVWDIAVDESFTVDSGFTMPFTATGDGLIGFIGKTAQVSFDTAEIEYLLNGASSATATLELELEMGDGSKWTILQTNCTIRNDMIDSSSFSPIGFAPSVSEAPLDGIFYGRKDGQWTPLTEIDGGTY
jgi:hypothetical protein